jgi:DNA-binding LytR/AlgR family response regulator
MQTAFFVRMNGKFQSIPFDSVLYITSRKNYCEIFTITKKKYLTYGSISYVEQKLPENLFCRVHRSYIISIGKIDAFDNNYVFLNEEKLPLSKEGFEKVMKRVILLSPEYHNKLNNEMSEVDPKGYLKKYRNSISNDNK